MICCKIASLLYGATQRARANRNNPTWFHHSRRRRCFVVDSILNWKIGKTYGCFGLYTPEDPALCPPGTSTLLSQPFQTFVVALNLPHFPRGEPPLQISAVRARTRTIPFGQTLRQGAVHLFGMRALGISAISLAMTAAVVSNAYYQKKQFYPSVVYITKSNPCMAVRRRKGVCFVTRY